MKSLLLLLGMTIPSWVQGAEPCEDFYCYMALANRASLVMLLEVGLVDQALAKQIGAAVVQDNQEQGEPGARRTSNYLNVEKRLIEIMGPEASSLHKGRSRQDLHGTVRRMMIRDALLEVHADQLSAREALLGLAERHAHTLIPAYTHGVQAQPTAMGHYLLAFAAALARDAQRLHEVFPRINQSSLGAAALGTSGYPIDRERLANLLGFNGPVENSYDANLVSPVDTRLEFANALAVSAIPIGQLMQNIHTQYADPSPWMLLGEGQTDVSSIMPQKSNPRALDRVRSAASAVVAGAQAVAIHAHNTNSGMNDYRRIEPLMQVIDDASDMYRNFARVVGALRIDEQRALAELNEDYSTMTEIADTLVRDANLPFREAHHYASELTHLGRSAGKRPMDLTDRELRRTYQETVGQPLPVPVAAIRAAMDPRVMVETRMGKGGPQPAEVTRMLAKARSDLAADRQWARETSSAILAALTDLEKRFNQLL